MRGGRARWKIENETFNTLKNQDYQFEHNFGHGNKNLSVVFAMEPETSRPAPGSPINHTRNQLESLSGNCWPRRGDKRVSQNHSGQ
jgi:hypothetical protein